MRKNKVWNVSGLRKAARAIFQAGLKAVDPEQAVLRSIRFTKGKLHVGKRIYDLGKIDRVLVVGGGKAGASMARALENVLGNRLHDGIVVVKYGHGLNLRRIQVVEAGHPVPDVAGFKGAQMILERLKGLTPKDLVVCLLSGGGSALLPLPLPGLSIEDKQETTRLLLECGATIQEMNAVRKHLSLIKGGQLVRHAAPARLITLALSDVVGDHPDVIASGPTVPDTSSFKTCHEILQKYGLLGRLPFPVRALIQKGVRGEMDETPKPKDPMFRRCQYLLVGNNRMALEASKKEAKRLGFHSFILSSGIWGETKEVAKVHVAIVREMIQSNQPIRLPACLVSGGETTVTIHGKGKGGRNLEFALAAALELEGSRKVVVLSGGTDGTDGPTDAAGAFVDGKTTHRARQKGLNPEQSLNQNDAYPFFMALGDLFKTGPTLTNVMDIRLFLVAP